MSEAVIVSILSLTGTLLGSLAGIIASGKLTNYRLSELEKKVGNLNDIIEKANAIEQQEIVTAERLRSLDHRVTSIENNRNKYSVN